MREYFRGWRRKAGVVTLVVACLVTIVWMRSQYFCDVATVQYHARYHQAYSMNGRIIWWSWDATSDAGVSQIILETSCAAASASVSNRCTSSDKQRNPMLTHVISTDFARP